MTTREKMDLKDEINFREKISELRVYDLDKGSPIIGFEGIDGCGKTTQTYMLERALKAHGINAIIAKEPGETEAGDLISNIIRDPKLDLHGEARMYLFLADRINTFYKVINPRLWERNSPTICDRTIYSTLAYQGAEDLKEMEDVIRHLKPFPLNLRPSFTFYIRVSLETAKKRRAGLDYFESKGDKYFKKVIDNYETLVRCSHPLQFKAIDGEQSPEGIHGEIIRHIKKLKALSI